MNKIQDNWSSIIFTIVVVEVEDLVKIARILKMGIDETHSKAAGESEDSAAIVRVKEADQVCWNIWGEKCFMKRLIEIKSLYLEAVLPSCKQKFDVRN